MPLHLYALVEEPARLPDVTGLAESVLSSIALDGFAALVSEVQAGSVDDTEAAVLAHAGVVDAAARLNDAILPVRFGSPVADGRELAATLGDRRERIFAAFDRVRGCVEFGLRVVMPPSREVRADSGRDYMLARLQHLRSAEELADAIDGPLAEVAQERTRQVLATPNLVLSSAYLVPRDRVSSFQNLVDDLGSRRPEAQLVCTGPWPPYTFAIIGAER